jgi:transposase
VSVTAHLLLTEVGADLSKFRSAAAFASWLGLCPDNRISGGKILSARTLHVVSRLAIALRLAAQSLHTSRSYLGDYFRRMCQKEFLNLDKPSFGEGILNHDGAYATAVVLRKEDL